MILRAMSTPLRTALALAITLPLLGCRTEAPVRVVLITLDTLRLDAFEGSEARPSVMPRVRARAREGLVFARSYAAAPTTLPTHTSLLTGLQPWEHGVARNGLVLGAGQPTVAERLRAAGFATAAVVASFPLHERFGLARGFDVYDDTFSVDMGRNFNGIPIPEDERFYRKADEVTNRALEVLAGLSAPRQFLWVHYFDAHAPYGDLAGGVQGAFGAIEAQLQELARPGATRETRGAEAQAVLGNFLDMNRNLYDADVRALDIELDRLLEQLALDADRFETHVVVVADHGESFGEDGTSGHGDRLSPVQLLVPCFVLSPRVAAGVHEEPVGSVDIHDALIALAGIGSGAAGVLEGAAGRPLGMRRKFDRRPEPLRGPGTRQPDEDFFYVVQDGSIIRGRSDGVTRDDLETLDAETAHRVEQQFDGFARQLGENAATALVDEETRRGLEALGYAQ